MINGTHQNLALSTVPEGSAATATGGGHCTTPCKLKLRRKHSVRVDFTHDGYKPSYVLVRSKLGGASVTSALIGGLPSVLIDAHNGATNYLTPSPIKVKLAAQGAHDEAILLGKNGAEQLVSSHNDEVRAIVARSIGPEAAGLAPPRTAADIAAGPHAAN